jgi:cytochrome c5
MRCWVPGVLLAVHALAQSPTDAGAGRRIFESQCAVCHGQIGGGGRGPVLNRPKLDKAQMTRRFASSSRRVCATCLEPGNCTPAKWLAWLSMSALLERCRKRRCPAMRRAARIYSANGCAGCHMVAGRGAASAQNSPPLAPGVARHFCVRRSCGPGQPCRMGSCMCPRRNGTSSSRPTTRTIGTHLLSGFWRGTESRGGWL